MPDSAVFRPPTVIYSLQSEFVPAVFELPQLLLTPPCNAGYLVDTSIIATLNPLPDRCIALIKPSSALYFIVYRLIEFLIPPFCFDYSRE